MLNVIYDASVLTNIFYKDSNRSGVFFAAFNILNELKKRKDINLALYFNPEAYADGVILKRDFFSDIHCAQDMSVFPLVGKICRKMRALYIRFYGRRFFRKIFALVLVCCAYIYRKSAGVNKDEMLSCNVFFSPIYKVPDFVRSFPNIKPYIFVYDLIPLIFPQYYPNGKPLVSSIMENAKAGDFFFFDSRSAEQDAQRFYPSVVKKNTAVAHLAANDNFRRIADPEIIAKTREKYNIPKGKKYIFSLCTLEPRKNLIRAVRTFLMFIQKNDIDDLAWVMGGAAWISFVDALKKEGVCWRNELIIRAGYVDDKDLPALYSGAEWFVYTSQYEGFGLPPLEAMQCGCPIVASNNSSLPEVVGDAGILIDYDSEEQHVQAYEKYYYNENIRKEFGRKGLERANHFSWKKTVNQIISVMEENKCLN
ncbi:MAG: glycosyltransferase family 4 protein [Fibrobacter sp.]|nr:glycosyltransferase family 4 protein [Fibrobacter sp.]